MTTPNRPRCRAVLCSGDNCTAGGQRRLRKALNRALAAHELEAEVEIQISGCQDRCDDAPNMTLMPGAFAYANLTPEAMELIVEQHIIGGEPVEELLLMPGFRRRRR